MIGRRTCNVTEVCARTFQEASPKTAIVGAERVVIGSDYPYDMGEPRAVERIEAAPFLSAQERELVLGRNALRLLGR